MSDDRPYWMLFYEYVPDIGERRAPYREEHLALIRSWKESGRLELAGALGDPPHSGAFVFRVDDAGEVDEFTAEDPYVANGLVTRRRVERWNVV
ncbi:MAG: YciI family protein [Thermoleophilaceae bacterium]